MNKMKLIQFFPIGLALMLGNVLTFAQTQKTLFSDVEQVGFYLSPNMQLGSVAGETAVLASFKGAITFREKFAIGGMYSLSLNEFQPSTELVPDTYLDLRMGGLFVEYTLQPSKLVHLTFPVSVGAGEIQLDWTESSSFYSTQDNFFGGDNFLFIEPGALLELNVFSYMKLNLGLTYRVVPGGVDYRGLEAGDISGLTGLLGLKFGLF